ncbi:MAG: PilZ domain-containing protein [Acidobacteria bacterium]|nr:PilZ domain-containing protein [Acidobacteriota bacterium]MDA1235946.1 PilZ domain-containing protein [Acidobacteriota bacterium]
MNFIQVLNSLTGRAAPPGERRKHERSPAQERAVVCWKDHLGLPKAHSISIVNVSIGGVAFASPDHLPVGQVITITTANRSLDCVVRHVRKTGRGYYAGAEVLSISADDDAMSAIRELAEDVGESGGK